MSIWILSSKRLKKKLNKGKTDLDKLPSQTNPHTS